MEIKAQDVAFKTEKYWELGMDAIYLASCALRGQTAQWDPKKELARLYRFCQFHTITAVVAMALERVWKTNPPEDREQMTCWLQARDKAIRKNILLNTERQAITQYMESIGCWHMPLKGSLLQFDYPALGMRQMTDNDILVDPEKRDEIHDFMCGRNYDVEYFRQSEVDTYQKEPVFNFEIHMALFSEEAGEDLERYYRDIRDKAVKDDDNSWGYHLSADDFYIYMVTHAYKHLVHGGIGIRNLLDVHVYLQKHGAELNMDYVQQELKKLGAAEFESQCRILCGKLLGPEMDTSSLTEQECLLLKSFFTSGTFGTDDQKFNKKLQQLQRDGGEFTSGTKIKFMVSRLFPPMDELRLAYPGIEHSRWKIPFIYIGRAFSVFFHPVKAVKEISRVWKARKSDG